MKEKKQTGTYLVLLFILLTPASLFAQEKFLKLTNIISTDSTITFTPIGLNYYSNKTYYRVPAGKYWKIQSINCMGIQEPLPPQLPRTLPASPLYIEINNKLINYTSTDNGFLGSYWCLPGDLIALYTYGTPGYTRKLDYRMIIFEFLLEQ